MMIMLHVWDWQGVYSHSVEADPWGEMPDRSTPQPLPALDGDQVARWAGAGWEVLPERPTPPVPGPVIPVEVTMRQARLALLQAGLLDQVETALAAMPGSEGQAARIEWDYSSVMRRDRPFVSAIGGLLGLDDAAIDQLFITAAGID